MTDLITRLREAGSTGLDMSPGDPLCAEAADALQALQSRLEAADKLCETRARQIAAMTKWLDENQRDVWRRGIWDVLNAAIAEKRWQPCGHDDPSWCTDKCVPPWKRAQEQKRDYD
jgi:hypothetical protein